MAERLVWMEYLVVEFLGSLLCFRGGMEGRGSDRKGVSEDVWERRSGGESEGVEFLEKKKEGNKKGRRNKKRGALIAPPAASPPFRGPAIGLCTESTVTCHWF